MGETTRPRAARSGVIRVAALGAAALQIGTGVAVGDVEAIVIGVLLFAALFLLPIGRGSVGRIALAILFLDVLGWMAAAAWSIAQHGEGVNALLVPLGLTVLAVVGVLAALGLPDRVTSIAAVVLFAAGLLAAVGPMAGSPAAIDAGAVRVSARATEFSAKTLRAHRGELTVAFRNHDLFWHTFTVDALHVDLRVPLGSQRAATFDAPAGRYTFYCAIPGHRSAGMKGTLIVD